MALLYQNLYRLLTGALGACLLLLGACQSLPPELTQSLHPTPVSWPSPESRPVTALLGPETDSGQAELNREYARQQFLLKNYSVAAYYFKKTLLERPDDPLALELLPWAYFFQKRFELALIEFSNAHAHFPRDPDPLVGMGWCYFGMQFYEQALDSFERAAAQAPENYEALKGRALTRLWTHHPTAARNDLDRLFHPDDVQAIIDQWRQWQKEDRTPASIMFPADPEEVTLFSLPPENPRFLSLLFPLEPAAASPALEKGWRLFRQGLYQRAVEAFEDLPGDERGSADAQNGLAWSRLHQGDIPGARQLFLELLARLPAFEGAVLGLRAVDQALEDKAAVAQYYFDLQKYRIAREKFEALEDDYPFWAHAKAMLGRLALAQNRYEEAAAHLKKALALDPREPAAIEGLSQLKAETDNLLYQADQARLEGNPKKAAYLYWEYIQTREPEETNTSLLEAYRGLAWSQLAKKQYRLALENFDRPGPDGEDPADLARGKGLAYFGAGDYARAAEWLMQAEQLGDSSEETAEALDWSVLGSRDPAEAEQYFLERLRRKPRQGSTYLALGWVYYRGGNPDLGVEYFLKAISLKPGLALSRPFVAMLETERFGWQIYIQMAWEYYRRKEYTHARRLFQAALAREPDSSTALMGLGYTFERLGEIKQAERYLRASLKENRYPLPVEEVLTAQDSPSPVTIKTNTRTKLGRVLLKSGRYQEALAVFLEAHRNHPTWPEVNDGLGWAYLNLGRLTESRAAFNQALTYQPLHPEAHRGLAQVKKQQAEKSLWKTGENLLKTCGKAVDKKGKTC